MSLVARWVSNKYLDQSMERNARIIHLAGLVDRLVGWMDQIGWDLVNCWVGLRRVALRWSWRPDGGMRLDPDDAVPSC